MPDFGFCGAAYQSQSVNANAQKCENLYLERDESGTGKSKLQLLCTPGTRTFVRLYDDITGLEVVAATYQGDVPVLTLPAGSYYAALVLFDANGVAQQRSRVFGPFPVSRTVLPPERHFLTINITFAAKIPRNPPAGSQWFIYFGTDRTNLNERLPIGTSDPVTSGASFLTNLPAAPKFIVDPAMGYVITANGLAQPVPGSGPSWYVLLNGPTQGAQTAAVAIPHFDTSKSNFSVGVLVRVRGVPEALQSYYVLGLSASTPQLSLYRVVNGSAILLASQNSIAIPDASVLQLSITEGLDLRASLNGIDVLTASDRPLIGGNMASGTTGFLTTGPAISSFISSTTASALSLNVTAPGDAAELPELTPPNAIYAGIEKDGRCFVASQNGFWEMFADGKTAYIGAIVNDFGVKYLAASQIQIAVASAGHLYIYTLDSGAFNEVPVLTAEVLAAFVASPTAGTLNGLREPIVAVGFSDTYFIALLADGFQLSGLEDGEAWDPADFTKIQVYADKPTAAIIDHRELIISGPKQGVVYYNSGNPLFPFDVVPGGFTESGVGAPASLVKADNTVFWIGADERGGRMAWRAEGYKPSRISTHAIEEHWRKFSRVSDAVGYSYQEAGHTFVGFFFPSVGETWIFDVSISLWHQRTKPLRCHFKAFDKHFMGDSATATIYEQSIDFLTHDGEIIKRDRTAPHISNENSRMSHNEFRLDMECGVGPDLKDGEGKPRNAQVMLQWSDDGGHTYSNPQPRACGAPGEYRKRVRWLRLGSSRDRVYKVTCSDPVPYRFINAYLNPEP